MTTAPATAPASSLLTIEDTGRQMLTEPWAILRLIARGKLAATRLGKTGPYMIVPQTVTEYVRTGAADFTPPPTRDNWFDGSDTQKAAGLPAAMQKEFDSQTPDDATVQAWFNANPETSYDIRIPADLVSKLITQAPPRSMMPNAPAPRFITWGDMFLAAAWRTAAAEIIKPKNLAGLYAPDTYRQTIDAAWNKALQVVIGGTSTKTFNPKSKTGMTTQVTVQFSFPVSSMTRHVSKSALEALTF